MRVLLLARLGWRDDGHCKGQIGSLDFIIALFIFVLLIAGFVMLWGMFSLRYIEYAHSLEDRLSAMAVSDRLLHSGGYPLNWMVVPLSAQSIGFAALPNELDWGKVSSFSSLNYTDQKRLLGIDQEFLIKIDGLDGARYATIGIDPGINASRAAEVTRAGFMNGTVVLLRVQVYEE